MVLSRTYGRGGLSEAKQFLLIAEVSLAISTGHCLAAIPGYKEKIPLRESRGGGGDSPISGLVKMGR